MATGDAGVDAKKMCELENTDQFKTESTTRTAVGEVTINRNFVVMDGKKVPVKNDFNGKRGRVVKFEESTRLYTVEFDQGEAPQGYGKRGSFQLWDFKWGPGGEFDAAQFQKSQAAIRQYGLQKEQEFQDLVRRKHPSEADNSAPYERQFIQFGGTRNPANVIRVMQFNILAHGLSGMGGGFAIMYHKDAPQGNGADLNIDDDAREKGSKYYSDTRDADGMMEFQQRSVRLLAECAQYSPDILCLEELDRYWDMFKPELESLGYEGDFWMKAKSAAQRSGANGGYRDGCGIFWNSQRFEQLGITRKFIFVDAKAKPCKQVGLYVTLRNKQNQQPFVVVASHNKSGEKAKDLPAKKAQAEFVADLIKREVGDDIPVIFACDFNTNTTTKAYQAFEEKNQKIGPQMISSYKTAGSGRETSYTTSKWRKGGPQLDKLGKTTQTIDFIFYSQKDWDVRSTLSIPDQSTLEPLLMPGWRYPSDHFSLVADLELKSGPANL